MKEKRKQKVGQHVSTYLESLGIKLTTAEHSKLRAAFVQDVLEVTRTRWQDKQINKHM